MEDLPRTAQSHVLLATDLHAGNVLRSEREPWLVIDPKPFVGDPAYDVTQHLFNCDDRLFANPFDTMNHFADSLSLDRERVRLWMFARAVISPVNDDETGRTWAFARAIAP
jgi:streptomycin 6-kinase